MRRCAFGCYLLAVLVTACVDLNRPTAVSERDAPVFGGRGGNDGMGGNGSDGSPTGGVGGSAGGAGGGSTDGPDLDVPSEVPLDPPDMLPDLPPDLPLVVNGKPCDQDVQCASNVCSNGVCCDRACTAACFACNLAGTAGTCSPVPAGEDPGNHCTQSEAATCGDDGTCNGSGGCRRYRSGTECAPGRCDSATEFAASQCDGAGACKAGASKACAPGVCMGTSCASSCTQQSQCQAGFFCDTPGSNRCTLKRTVGSACSMAFQCGSGFCVDGVCCGSQCGQQCFACNVAGSVGTCRAVPSGEDPRSQCPAEAASSCGRAGGCNGAGACLLHATTTTCAAGSCASPTAENGARTCNGLGVCQPAVGRACSPYFCAGSGCATSCSTNNDCQPGFGCTNTTCGRVPGLALYWRFEESTGGTAFDSSGNNLHGTYIGEAGTPASSGVIPPLLYPNTLSRAFTITSRHAVRLANFPALLRVANNVTMSVWFRTTGVDNNSGEPIGSELVSVGNAYLLRIRHLSGEPPSIEVSKRTTGQSAQCRVPMVTAIDGNWHHMAAVLVSDGPMRLYFDGVERCVLDRRENISYAGVGVDMFVGRHGDNETQWDFGGNIDEVRIYTRGLSAAEIAALAQGRN